MLFYRKGTQFPSSPASLPMPMRQQIFLFLFKSLAVSTEAILSRGSFTNILLRTTGRYDDDGFINAVSNLFYKPFLPLPVCIRLDAYSDPATSKPLFAAQAIRRWLLYFFSFLFHISAYDVSSIYLFLPTLIGAFSLWAEGS